MRRSVLGRIRCYFFGCQELDVQVAGTKARARFCPVCLRANWVD
jgi:hypothetical protein